MENITSSYQNPQVIKATFTWLENLLAPLPVVLDGISASRACAGLKSLPSNPVVKAYRDGSKLLKYDFVVMIQVPRSDTAAKLDAIAELTRIGNELKISQFPELVTATVQTGGFVTNPAQVDSDDSGADKYEAVYRFTYRTR